MYLDVYYRYVLRSLLLSRAPVNNTHKIVNFNSIYLRTHLDKVDDEIFFFLPTFFLGLTGRSPGYLYRINRRTKTRFVAGVRMCFRKKSLYHFLSILINLVLIDAVNFRGFFLSKKKNKTVSIPLEHLSYYHGTSRAFDNDLFPVNDNTMHTSMQLCVNDPSQSNFLLRALFLPVNNT